MAQRQIWMVGTAPTGKGGIASVVQQYRDAGVFDGDSIHYEPSHDDKNSLGRVLPFLRCASRLWPAMLMGRVLLLHAHTSFGGSFWRKLMLALPAFALSIPVIVHLHAGSFIDFHARGGAWRKYCLRLLLRRAYRVVVLSAEWHQWANSVEPEANVVVVPNSLSAVTGCGGTEDCNKRPTVLFLGRISDSKGAFDLLSALAMVRESVQDLQLLIGGDGDVVRLNQESARLGLEGVVKYVGWADSKAKSLLFASCWVFALPSYKEGLPMSIREAMAFSRAVVACPVGGIPLAVEHNVTGMLSPPGDVVALAANLRTILSSTTLARKLGQAGRQSFEHKFSHEANLPKIFALYREAGAKDLPIFPSQNQSTQ